MNQACKGCGAPLQLLRTDCSYCRRQYREEEPKPSPYKVAARYGLGMTDPRAVFGEVQELRSVCRTGTAHNDINTLVVLS